MLRVSKQKISVTILLIFSDTICILLSMLLSYYLIINSIVTELLPLVKGISSWDAYVSILVFVIPLWLFIFLSLSATCSSSSLPSRALHHLLLLWWISWDSQPRRNSITWRKRGRIRITLKFHSRINLYAYCSLKNHSRFALAFCEAGVRLVNTVSRCTRSW